MLRFDSLTDQYVEDDGDGNVTFVGAPNLPNGGFDPAGPIVFDNPSPTMTYPQMVEYAANVATSGVTPAASVSQTVGPTGIVRRSPPSTRTVVSPIVAAVKAPDYSLVVIAVAAVAVAFVGRVLLSR